MKILKKLGCIIIFLIANNAFAQYGIKLIDTSCYHLSEGVNLAQTSFRGLYVLNNKTVWFSGNKGTIGKSNDGCKNIFFFKLKNYPKSDFRDIHVFDKNNVIVMSSGTPAYILKSGDGGYTWKEVFKSMDTLVFLDAIDFWDNKNGVIVGDPIGGKFFILKTNDGGNTWLQADTSICSVAQEGEAIFASSGTSLKCWGKTSFGFVTGGSVSNFYSFPSINSKAQKLKVNIQQGSNSKGAFSFIKTNAKFIAVGGDYLSDTTVYKNYDEIGHTYMYEDLGDRPSGYLSCIEKINNSIFIACGTNGVDVYFYNTKKWLNLSKKGFNVVSKSAKGNAIFMAGSKGRIGKLVYTNSKK